MSQACDICDYISVAFVLVLHVHDTIVLFTQPYLNKMNDKLIHDEVLLEKQSYRDKLSTDLKKIKSELDTMREKFRVSQARDGADVERLTKLSQVCY